jgi:hypothetical protein
MHTWHLSDHALSCTVSKEEKYYIIDTTDKPFTISEVKKVKKSLKTGKSSGPDLISNAIFKGSCPLIVKSITKLFNMIFSYTFSHF